MSLKLYNTLTKREEEFVPKDPKVVTMYTCGPTVYGRPHIGNYSSFLMADLLRRFLEVSGYEVKHVKNITDVGHLVLDRDDGEDKVEQQARAEKIDPLAIAKKYEEMYLEDERNLGLLEPFSRPRATETIPEMLEIIRTLLKNGHAYETADGIYFSVQSFPGYGKLSGNTLENLHAGSRVDVREEKKHPADFALWKKCVGENSRHLLRWNFETGRRASTEGGDRSAGFPGWHIECSAMSRKFLGEQIDIHTGGEDNIFPHHECEIAQSESSGKKPFVRIWLHKRRIEIGMDALRLDPSGLAQGASTKMSKSLGNVLTISDIIEKGFSPLDLRYYLFSVHYRTQLKFRWKGIEDAHKARRKITEWISEWSGRGREGQEGQERQERQEGQGVWSKKFMEAMESDLNTPAALAVVFDAMTWTRNQRQINPQMEAEIRAFQRIVEHTFGCFAQEEEDLPSKVTELLRQRKEVRARKDFVASDRLRDEIRSLGFEVRDEGQEQTVKRM